MFKVKVMDYAIKTEPNDFRVREKLNPQSMSIQGQHHFFVLEKKSWSTLDALHKVAQYFDVPDRDIGFGGLKDKHAHTFQYISLPKIPLKAYEIGPLKLHPVGAYAEAMKAQMIEVNEFEIKLRRVKQADISLIKKNALRVSQEGFVNYFDEQRFAVEKPSPEAFFTYWILQEDFLKAFQSYWQSRLALYKGKEKKMIYSVLAGTLESFPSASFHEKDQVLIHWMMKEKKRDRRFFEQFFKKVHRHELMMNLSALQSLYWNKKVEVLIQERFSQSISIPGQKMNFVVPLLNPGEKFNLDQLLTTDEIQLPLKLKYDTAHAFERFIYVQPLQLTFHPYEKDPDKEGTYQLPFTVSLAPSSYATMLIKRLMLRLNKVT